MNGRRTQQAHEVVATCVHTGHRVIDATVGNGHDTLFLARRAGNSGHVFGFDVQPTAIDATQRRLQEHRADPTQPPLADVSLIASNHAQMAEHIPLHWHGRIQAIMFNLGYLPGCDHALTTLWPSTLEAIDAGRRLLAAHGIMSVLCYPGHAAGRDELDGLLQLISRSGDSNCEPHLNWSEHDPRAAPETAPRLFIARLGC